MFPCCRGGGGADEPERVFGADLSRMRAEDLGEAEVPRVLRDCAKYIREHGMEKEGIFRRAGSSVKMKELKQIYNNGGVVELSEYGGHHQAANVIKTFFRELRQPIMTFALYPLILKFSDDNDDAKLRRVREMLMQHLPPRNLTVLRALVMFLMEVTGHADKNGMTGSNVAIVFGPNLFWAKGAGPNSGKIPTVAEVTKISNFTQFMFENSAKIFHEISVPGYIETVL